MSNRFLLAKSLNIDDELVWYKRRYDDIYLKCIWRKVSNNELTFLSIKMDEGNDDLGQPFCKEGRVFSVFRLGI